jgi:hypothetical protein
MTTAIERNGERVRLEVYANGTTCCTVAAFDISADEPRAIGTDHFNLNRAKDRDRWAETLPADFRAEAVNIATEIGIEVERFRANARPSRGTGETVDAFPVVEPWQRPVAGAQLLEEVATLLSEYVVLPPQGHVIVPLWIAHTYASDCSDYTPYLHVSSPVRGCGKSVLLDLLEHLADRACRSDGITAAALYRRIDRLAPSMLMDEMDTRLHGESGELLRGVLNSGFCRGGRITICVGDDHEERNFRTFCPKVLSGIGRLWDTVQSRSITIRMEKASRAELEQLTRLRRDRIGRITEPLRRKFTRWASDAREDLNDADPDVPDVLEGRQADVWRPLLAIADAVGGPWVETARAAAVALAGSADDEGDWALMLLHDLRDLFTQQAMTDDKLASEEIAKELAKREDRPWPEYRKERPISPRQIASLLSRFGIKPKNLRLGTGQIVKGYRFGDCFPAFTRYITPPPAPAATSATPGVKIDDVADVAAQDATTRESHLDDRRYESDERAGMQDA